MDRKELLDAGWQLSQDWARLLTVQLHNPKAVQQAQLDDIEDHLEVVEVLLGSYNWKA